MKSWSCIFIPFFKRFVYLMHAYCIFYRIMHIYTKCDSCRFLVLFRPIFVAGLDSPRHFESALIPYKT